MRRITILLLTFVTLAFTACHNQQKQTSMTYRPLGNTGLEVSEISIGCGGFEKLDSAGSIALMDMALTAA